VRRGITGRGGKVEVSLMESILDAQFELLTTYLNGDGKPPTRSAVNNGNAYLGAPYGIYQTADGFLALAMGSVTRLGELLECPSLASYADSKSWFECRDEIKGILAQHLKTRGTDQWLAILEPADIWCSDVFTWAKLVKHDAFKALDMVQDVLCREGTILRTTRCPIRIDGEIYKSANGAPRVGQHTDNIIEEFALCTPSEIV
jgi:crotonobetainyl-CoA:carnitine CoA-transferase CaiB-like acyl-CoA transferase